MSPETGRIIYIIYNVVALVWLISLPAMLIIIWVKTARIEKKVKAIEGMLYPKENAVKEQPEAKPCCQ